MDWLNRIAFVLATTVLSCADITTGWAQTGAANLPTGAPAIAAGSYASAEEMVVRSAGNVLTEAMQSPGNRIPQSMLNDAYGVAIIPNVIKGSFFIGARHGRGLLFVREPSGIWHAPVFITLAGGNIGWQIGVQSSDLVLVFKSQRSIQGLLSGKLTLGADAAAAAGPVGREAAVATDGKLQAEIYTYSRSRGLFAGISIDGSIVQVDQFATGAYYPRAVPGGPVTIPPSAAQLTVAVASYAGHGNLDPAANQDLSFVQQQSARVPDVLRAQIVQLSPKFFALLDDQWTSYLALPLSMLRGTDPSPAELEATLARFDEVARNPQFAALASRPEFRSLDGLLRHYQQALSPTSSELQLPPPPNF